MAVVTEIKIIETLKENRWSAEFFNPKYVFVPNEEYRWIRIGNILSKCQYGISVAMNESGRDYPIYRMNEIDNCFLTKPQKFANISKNEFNIFQLRYNDILFNRTNSFEFVGRTGILKEHNISVFASYLIRINPRQKFFLPEFLTIYLNTSFGIGQIKRRAMHSINQANVSASELKRISIPLVDLDLQKDISEIVNESFNLKKRSESVYSQAEQLIEQELGLDKIKFKKSNTSEASFSDIITNNRSDAEFYNPELGNFYFHLSKKCELSTIAEYAYILKFSNPTYALTDIPIITQRHLRKLTPKDYADDLSADLNWVRKYPMAVLKENDLLFYSVGAYLGKTNIWLNSEDKAVPASFITILRTHNDYDAGYLTVLLNSNYGILQSKTFQSGTSQQYIYPKDIRQFKIPNIPIDLRKRIFVLLQKSFESDLQSENLLVKAKSRVEELIEQGVN